MFVLKYFEGYGNQEIAELMGTSSMVVGVVLHRARAKVRRELGDYIGDLTESEEQEKGGAR
jgi:DNA-directed RNA polymerase specialized sigma24 family protein